MRKILGTWPGLAVALLSASPTAWSQELTLSKALELADTQAFGNRMASLQLAESRGQNLSASASFLPVVRAEVGVMATDDPLASFGTRLSQRRVSMASFDPAKLNDPDVIPGWNAALIAEVPLINVDAWQAKRITGAMVEANRLQTVSMRQQMHARILEAWTSVAIANDAVRTWDAALLAMENQERKVMSVYKNGMANRADQLLVSVKLSEYRTQRNKAVSDFALAKAQIPVLLGSEDAITMQIPELPSDTALRLRAQFGENDSLSVSQAIAARQVQMAQANLVRARATFVPRLNGMARMDWKERDLEQAPEPSWTVGVTASWTVFQGAKDWGEMNTAQARRDLAKVALQETKARENLQSQAAQAQLQTALEQMNSTVAAIVQAQEAVRILTLQYEQGLAELADVLQAQAMLVQLQLTGSAARQSVITALSHRALLHGRDPASLASLIR